MAMSLWTTRPYSLAGTIDRLFDQAFVPYQSNGTNGETGSQPVSVNLWETEDAYVAAFMMPGLDEQSINATVHQDTLLVEGDLRMQVPEGAKAIWQEFGPARFRRSLRLGSAVDASRVEAAYKNGLLLVTMPKAEHAKPRQIQVRVGDSS